MSFERVCVARRWRNHSAISLPLSSQTNRPNWLFPRLLFRLAILPFSDWPPSLQPEVERKWLVNISILCFSFCFCDLHLQVLLETSRNMYLHVRDADCQHSVVFLPKLATCYSSMNKHHQALWMLVISTVPLKILQRVNIFSFQAQRQFTS